MIDVKRFVPLEEFREKADDLFANVKGVPTDAETKEILIPVELEFRTKEKGEREGIPIPEKTWSKVTKVAEELSVDVEEILESSK